MPTDTRPTPASRKPGKRARSTLLGFTSRVTSPGRRSWKCRANGVEQAGHRVRLEQRWGAAAEIHAREGASGKVVAPRLQLGHHGVDVAALALGRETARRHHGEVAVGADPLTERHVDVDADVGHDRQGYPQASQSAVAPARYSDAALSQPVVHSERLPNGLTVLLCETDVAPVAEFQIWAKTGSADERDDERGLAHFHEHMLFKGTERRGVGDVAGEVEGAGGRINAYTSYDVTCYHATLPSDALGVGIDVISDAVLHSVFDPAELDREIEVVLEEIRRGEDSPGSVLATRCSTRPYAAHPYQFPILGTHESVASLNRDRLRAFYERWYTPDNLVAVVTGQFERGAVLEALGQAFAGQTGRGARRQRPQGAGPQRASQRGARPPLRADVPRDRLPRRGSGPRGRALPRPHHLPVGKLREQSTRAAGERKGRLVERIDAWSYTPLDAGITAIDIETDAARTSDALVATLREVERLRREPVSSEELEKARINFLASEHFERESVSGLASKLGGFFVTGGGLETEARYLASVREATAADLLRVAQTYWHPDRLTVGVLLPTDDAAAVDEASIRGAVDRAVTDTRAGLSRCPPRDPRRRPVSYELDGGAALHVLPRHGVPVVAARGAFLGGLLAEDPTTSGITAFMASMWMRGTESHSSAGFARAVESHAAEIDAFAGSQQPSDSPSRFRPKASTRPSICSPRSCSSPPSTTTRSSGNGSKPSPPSNAGKTASASAPSCSSSNSSTSQPPLPHAHPGLRRSRSRTRPRQRAPPPRPPREVRESGVGRGGDVDPDAIARGISSRLAGLDAGAFEPPSPPIDAPPKTLQQAELQKDRSQAHLVIGFPGMTVHDEDRFALDVIAQMLAGQGGRLFLELRDKQSLAYSVSATNVEGLAPGYFAVYIATGPDKLEQARAGLLDELRRVLDGPPDEKELDHARRHLIGNFAIDQQRNAVHAAQASLNALYGLGADAHRHYPEQIASVSREDALRVARRIIDLDVYTEAVIRGKESD